MKQVYLICLCSWLLFSCGEEEFLYRGGRLLQFNKASDYTFRESFVFKRPDVTRDTVLVTVDYLGDLADEPLYFDIEQVDHKSWRVEYDEFGNVTDSVPLPVLQAVEGVHYEPVDKALLVVPPRGLSATFPVVFLRAASLEVEERYLRLRLVPGPGLGAGNRNKLENLLLVTDQLVKPDLWDQPYFAGIFGKYSRVKHRLMIDTSGLNWDDDTFLHFQLDGLVFLYYIDLCNEALVQYRNEHGGEYLRDEDGEIVYFPGSMP
jgi:hypothetical protein